MGENDQILEAGKRMIPIYGTYLEARDFAKNPTWGGALTTGLSALGDAAMVFGGAGMGIKGAALASKAARATKAANVASTAAHSAQGTYDVAKVATKLATKKATRLQNGVNSMSLMGDVPTSTIMARQRAANAAKQAVTTAAKNERSASTAANAAINNARFMLGNASRIKDASKQAYDLSKTMFGAGTAFKPATIAVDNMTGYQNY